MPIKITTLKNRLGKSDKPFFVRTESSGRVDFEELVRIMAHGRTTITAPDIAGTLLLLKEELHLFPMLDYSTLQLLDDFPETCIHYPCS